ncbi:MAG: glycosyltransferase family 2 protein [Rhodanobacteraceae bacterium]
MEMVQHFPALNPTAAPVCSVCVANYNGERLVADCLDSVLAQQGDIPIEIIVHDDASSDGSVALLRERYPQVELLVSENNVGFCASNNRMVAQARGKYVLLLNNDAALFPDALSALIEAAGEQGRPGILTLPQCDWETGSLVDRGCLLDPFYNPVPNLDPHRRDVAYGIGACLFLPRELWNELGGFPEWFGSMAEDIYLCCLARLRGCGVQALPRSGFRHRLGTSFGGARITEQGLNTTVRRRRLSERNKTFVLFICTPTPAMWPVLLIHLSALLMEGAVLSAIRRDSHIFTDIYANVFRCLGSEWKRLRAVRKLVQGPRTATSGFYFRPFTWIPYKLRLLRKFGMPNFGG